MTGLFPNALHVARRELFVRIRNRTFIITTAILAIIAGGVVLLPTILTAAGVDAPPEVAVANEAGDLPTDPATMLRLSYDDQAQAEQLVQSVDDVEAAREEVRAGDLDGLLIVGRDGDELTFELFADAGPTSQLRLRVQQVAQAISQQHRLEQAGVPAEEQQRIAAPVAFEVVPPEPSEVGPTGDEFGGAFILTWAVIVLTFMAILTYGNWVAQSVAEEKSNRVMELLITAATPRQLLAGKVLGTGAAGLTQYVIVLLVAAIAFLATTPIQSALGVEAQGDGISLPSIEPVWIGAFTLFFLGGFMLYATLYAAAGSMVSRIEDVQQATGPLLLGAMGGYFMAVTAVNVPSAEWVALASLVPFFSPYLMPIRMLLGSPPSTPEMLLALGLLAVAIVVAIWLAARIYSAGVLLYGQRVGVRSVLRATRVSR